MAFSLGGPYGTTSLKYFRDHRNAAVERSHVALRQGAHFPTFFSPNPDLALSNGSRPRDRWLHMPSYTRFNLDNDRSTQLTRFYQVGCPATTQWGGLMSAARGDFSPSRAPSFAFSEPLSQQGTGRVWLGAMRRGLKALLP